MKNLIVTTTIILVLFVGKTFAQDTFESKAKTIATNIENITKQEKAALKQEVEAVNMQLDKKEISQENADAKKQQLAAVRAKNIETKVAVEQQNLNNLVKNQVDGKIAEVSSNKKRHSIGIFFSASDGHNAENYRKKSDRWWMEIPYPPTKGLKFERHTLLPCSYKDYEMAVNNEIPDRWWQTYQKLA